MVHPSRSSTTTRTDASHTLPFLYPDFSVIIMSLLNRLGPRAASLTRFIAERAAEAKASYVLAGASALIIRGVIHRETKVSRDFARIT